MKNIVHIAENSIMKEKQTEWGTSYGIGILGAAHEVTGSCHYLSFGDKHILVDCGMEQGPDLYTNQEIPVNAAMIDYVFVTHAHIDHSGLLPLLYNHGSAANILYLSDQ